MRNTTFKKVVAGILAIVMIVLVFAGCGEKQSEEPEKTENAAVTSTETVYVPEYISLPENFVETDYICSYEDKLYFTCYIEEKIEEPETGESYVTYSSKLYQMNVDGTGLAELPEFKMTDMPENLLGYPYITSMSFDNEGSLWITEYIYLYHLDENEYFVDDGRKMYLRKLSTDGAELMCADISGLAEENPNFYIGAMTIDSSGRIYITNDDKRVFVLDNEGKQLFALDSINWVNAVITLSDGSAAGMTYDNGLKVKRIDTVSQSWAESYPLLISAISAYSGNEDYPLFYIDASTMFAYDGNKGEFTELLNWMDLDINGENISDLTVLGGGEIACAINNYNGQTWSSEIIIISKKPVSEVPEKTILQMACFGLESDMRAAVIDFNKRNAKYRVEVTDYSEYNTDGDDSAGLVKLNTELISGNVPDLLCTSRLAVKQYAAKGLFEDLYPFIDNDTELGGREALIMEVFKAFETDGTLYEISPSFGISTVMGKRDVVGTESGWGFDELITLWDNSPEGTQAFPNMDAEGAIYLLTMVMHEYVDWQTGICSYDSEGFIELLEFAMRFPTEKIAYSETDTMLLRDGRALLLATHLTTLEEIQLYKGMFDGEITFVGYPTGSGNGSAFTLSAGLAMISACKNKEGAWEFMRTILSEDYQTEYSMSVFPTNKAAFEKSVENAMEKNLYTNADGVETEQAKGTWSWDSSMAFEIFATSPEEIEQIRQLIQTTEDNLSYDETLLSIIQEEAKTYIAGQTNARETAELIQRRVSTYINEQK